MMAILSTSQTGKLDEEGYLRLPALLDQRKLDNLRLRLEALWEQEGKDAGSENYMEPGARRLANLAAKGELFGDLFAHPLVLSAVRQVIGPDARLSMLNARDALPGAGAIQPLHADTDKAGVPDERGYYACTAIWMLDDFTQDNGATRLVPRSHLSHKVPKQLLDDIFAPHPQEMLMTGRAGDVLLFNGHCWHRGGQNRTNGGRLAILAHYLRADILRPAARRQHLTAEQRARMSPDDLNLLGLADD